MPFQKYQHVEKFGSDEVEGIEQGIVHIFPKIDGTNASIWWDCGIHCGSRSREIAVGNDNHGFAAWADKNSGMFSYYFSKHPEHRLYGEWLVRHTVKDYRDTAWNKFYVFDITVGREDAVEYMPYETYSIELDECGIDYVLLMAIANNATAEQFIAALDANTFLMKDGAGPGEGIVLKSYGYHNKYGRQTWAKLVRAEFKEKHSREMGTTVINGKKMIELELSQDYCTDSLVQKEYAKMVAEKPWRTEQIPELLGRVYHAVVTEHIWDMVKKNKNPTIDFKQLQRMVNVRIKSALPEVF